MRKLDLQTFAISQLSSLPCACRCHIYNLTSRSLFFSLMPPPVSHLHALSSTPSDGRMLHGSTHKNIHKSNRLERHDSRSQCPSIYSLNLFQNISFYYPLAQRFIALGRSFLPFILFFLFTFLCFPQRFKS